MRQLRNIACCAMQRTLIATAAVTELNERFVREVLSLEVALGRSSEIILLNCAFRRCVSVARESPAVSSIPFPKIFPVIHANRNWDPSSLCVES
jgi:hypothetical protein